jgi:hypothetical protein
MGRAGGTAGLPVAAVALEDAGDVFGADSMKVQMQAAGTFPARVRRVARVFAVLAGAAGAARTTFTWAKVGGAVRAASSRGRRHRQASNPPRRLHLHRR